MKNDLLRVVKMFAIAGIFTLRASEAAAQSIVISPVYLCVGRWVGVFVGLLPR